MNQFQASPNLSPSQTDFFRAVEVLEGIGPAGDFAAHWLKKLTIVEYVRCEFHPDGLVNEDVEKLQGIDKEGNDFRSCLDDAWKIYCGAFSGEESQQLLQILVGLTQGVLAAVSLNRARWKPGQPLPENFLPHATKSYSAYKTAWPLLERTLVDPQNPFGDSQVKSKAAMGAILPQITDNSKTKLNVSAWLTVRRLMAYLLGEEPRMTGWETTTPVLTVGERKKEGHTEQFGKVIPLTVGRADDGLLGFYLDPVTVGLTVIDDRDKSSMRESLQLAWRVCQGKLLGRMDDKQMASVSLRVAPQVTGGTRLEGASASGAFACGMYAAATETPLNSDQVASMALQRNPVPSQTEDLDVSSVVLMSVSAETLHFKLEEAKRKEIKEVVLVKGQQLVRNGEPHSWEVWTPKAKTWYSLDIHGVDSIPETMEILAGDAKIERVLKRYAEKQEQAWEKDRRSVSVEGDALLYYVPAHFGSYKPQQNGKTKYHRCQGDTEADRLEALMRVGKWLRIAEDPGVGKSVFMKRLHGFLSSRRGWGLFGGKPPLVVLWEETDGAWPETDFLPALQTTITEVCDTEPDCTSQDVVQYALKHKRVVILLDAMDQVGNAERIEGILRRLREFLGGGGQDCRVILTGRPLIMEANKRKLPRFQDWRLAHIEEFDLTQQYHYLYGPTEVELQELFGQDWAETVQVVSSESPTESEVLADSPPVEDRRLCLHRLVEETETSDEDVLHQTFCQRFPRFEDMKDLLRTPYNLFLIRQLSLVGGDNIPTFESRADIYLRTCNASIHRAIERLSAKVHPPEAVRETTMRLQAILAAIACEMMVRDPASPQIQGDAAIADFRQAVDLRLGTQTITDSEWRLLQQVTPITRRGIMREWEDEELRWHHPRMMQFYCGLHLARNTQPGWDQNQWQKKTLIQVGCGDDSARPQAANPQWEEAFRFAMEIPAKTRNDSVLTASLSLLFEPPAPEFSRPSQLIWEAWQLFEPEDGRPARLSEAQVLRCQFQQAYQDILQGKRGKPAQQIALAFERGFVRCPQLSWKQKLLTWLGLDDPTSKLYRFRMGTPGGKDEASVEVELSPFLMQQFPVTREQYALYDPQHDQEHQKDMENYAPQLHCPVINVTWGDAWCFAMFTGKALPSEAQWEYACRAGTTTTYSFGDDKSQLGDYSWYIKNANSTQPVGMKRPNPWGLYDMHGNVLEWCADWYSDSYYEELKKESSQSSQPADNPQGSNAGWSRVLRGGSWRDNAVGCRSALRNHLDPSVRFYHYVGFRVCRGVS